MPQKSWLRILAALTVLTLLVVACGADDDTDEASAEEDTAGAEEDGDDADADDGADDADADADADEGADDGEAAATGGDLIIGTTDEPTSLDPATFYDTNSSQALFNIGETLVYFPAGETEVAPLLAEELPDISDDGLTYTFQLREGVTFHDGSEMTSEDVAFSLNRSVDMDHPQGAGFLLAGIENIETPDDYTVEITLNEPNITFQSRLAYTVGTILPADGHAPDPDG